MHQYLKAIGFDDIKLKKDLYKILDQVKETFTHQQLIMEDEEMDYCEFRKAYGDDIGICLFGDMNLSSQLERLYYFPYFFGNGVTSYAEVAIERRSDREAYIGICEDSKVSINLIFHVQNTLEYLRELQLNGGRKVRYTSVTLSALSNEGMILLPISKDEHQKKEQKENVKNRMKLITAAKAGDPAAIESLTLDDMDTYSKVSRRLVKEDIFSIVETSIMPYGVECDEYSILGTIMGLKTIKNQQTEAELYVMDLEVNDLRFSLCAPKDHIVGEPAVGRRFKGNIWLQGRINFN